jgi:aconitate hydratase
LCSLAAYLGAAGAVFVSDEKTEVYLRDQRRSKAHRTLVPDPGAPCDDVATIDLSAVDPLVLDQKGEVRPVRDLEGTPIRQAVLGGDSGASLRDMLAAAALLKSKRVPAELDFLVAPPSRQVLEVLAQSGALVDLIATGARLIEPDHRVVSAELYPPPQGAASIRTFDPAPGTPPERGFIVASAETLAYSVSTGFIGDPRSFKRPVRVTVPRTLPTDDVLVVRKQRKARKGDAAAVATDSKTALYPPTPWKDETTLAVVSDAHLPKEPSALVLDHLDGVSWAIRNAARLAPHVRVVVSSYLPSGMVSVFSGLGILALSGDPERIANLRKQVSLTVPAMMTWKDSETITVVCEGQEHPLTWQARGAERTWTLHGTSAAAARN